jgi:GNAT superfamily N-acetyltransferase
MPASVLDGLSIGDRESFWRECLRSGNATVLVADVDGCVVGWLALGASRDDDADESVAEIYAMYVDPSRWSQRVGTALWAEAEHWLGRSSFERVTLWVLEGNARARRFYELIAFALEPDRVKRFEIGGVVLLELRYARPVSRRQASA